MARPRSPRRAARAALAGAWLLAAHGALAGEPVLRAGFGRAPITPVVADAWTDVNGDGRFDDDVDRSIDRNRNGRFDAVLMAGFANPRPASGVRDELEAVAVVFDDGTTRVGIVAADVIGLSHTFVEKVRSVYAKELGLDYVVVAATGNRAGPDTIGLWGRSRFSSGILDGYLKFVRQQMGTALAQAVRRLEPAELSAAELDGGALRVALVTRAGGDDVLGTLLNADVLPALLGAHNFELSADVAGQARHALDEGLGPSRAPERAGLGGTTLWLTGNVGASALDVRTRDASAARDDARAEGERIAALVLDARAAGAFARLPAPRLAVAHRTLELPIADSSLALLGAFGVMQRDVDVRFGFETPSEVALLRVGDLWLACVPGALAPALADARGVSSPALREALHGRVRFFANFANDALGALLPRGQTDASGKSVVGFEATRLVRRALLGLAAGARGDAQR